MLELSLPINNLEFFNIKYVSIISALLIRLFISLVDSETNRSIFINSFVSEVAPNNII